MQGLRRSGGDLQYEIDFSAAARDDFFQIFSYLNNTYIEFGDQPETALQRAYDRMIAIWNAPGILRHFPRRGQIFDLEDQIRYLSIDQVTYWFKVDDSRGIVEILGVFLGKQDHIRAMKTRLEDI